MGSMIDSMTKIAGIDENDEGHLESIIVQIWIISSSSYHSCMILLCCTFLSDRDSNWGYEIKNVQSTKYVSFLLISIATFYIINSLK